jgi:phosphotriesterase-related protein
MANSEGANSGMIPTLRGRIPSNKLGTVLVHEHVFCRVRGVHLPVARKYLTQQLQSLEKYGPITIIDLTTYVLPDEFIETCNAVSGVNIIACAGYYLTSRVPASYRSLDATGLADRLREKLARGIGRSKIKPGIIKVATSGHNFTRLERDILRAAAIVQSEKAIPIATHACRGGRQQLETLLKWGADPRKVFLSHMEMELKGNHTRAYGAVVEDILWILQKGAYVFFGDFTASESSYRRDVIRLLRDCINAGFIYQLFLSTDSYWSCRGDGVRVRGTPQNSRTPRTYEYLFTLIIPVLRRNGFSEYEIQRMTKENAVNFFSYTAQTSPLKPTQLVLELR